ncbi:adhesin [Paenibacillus sp. LS1]|uniref:iron-sulfur cluster biosynthesis family protein n=1 Tax=Paenibacillus sp. LS1 TaxID=2992120 RepID=UPI00222F25BA|nr:iron-sulfur cluster biosynthesis family protein [Paenibacillus sp. LS1]MCW3794448.1 adhesin [Paenibacillus sp. LS1]
MIITDGAKTYIEEMMKQAGVNTLRFAVAGGGCCGPTFQLGLAESQESDVVQEINAIRVAIDPELTASIESITLDVEQYPDGPGLVVSGGQSC